MVYVISFIYIYICDDDDDDDDDDVDDFTWFPNYCMQNSYDWDNDNGVE